MARGDSAMGQHHGGGGPIGTALWGSTMGQGVPLAQRCGAEGPMGHGDSAMGQGDPQSP